MHQSIKKEGCSYDITAIFFPVLLTGTTLALSKNHFVIGFQGL